MMRKRRLMLRLAKFVPAYVVFQIAGCIPDNAFAQVLAENIVLTAGVVIQTITSVVFNTIFGVI